MRHSKGSPIKWSPRVDPIKNWMPGHSPVQFGRSAHLGDGIMAHEGRSYVVCECGQQFSGQGEGGGQRSHARHINRLKFVHHHDEGQPCNEGCMPERDFKAMHRA